MIRRLGILCSGVLCALIVFTCLTLFVFVKIQVPTGSMYPAINLNDKLFVSRTTKVNRGEIVMFYSNELQLNLIKRLIGLPGDNVLIISGEVFVNGEKLEEDYVLNKSYEDMEFDVPSGSYLFLGDNRSASADARYWKDPYIKKSELIGKAVFRFYPYNNLGWLK